MAITRRGNRIDFTGPDASKMAKKLLPSMRDKPPVEKEYTVKVKFFTSRPGRGKSISGGSGFGEVDINVKGPFDVVKNKTSLELIQFCTQAIQANPKITGSVIGLEILEIIEKGSAAAKQPPPARLKPSGPAKPSNYGKRGRMVVLDRDRKVSVNGEDTMLTKMKCESCSYVTFLEVLPKYCPQCGARIVDHIDVSL